MSMTKLWTILLVAVLAAGTAAIVSNCGGSSSGDDDSSDDAGDDTGDDTGGDDTGDVLWGHVRNFQDKQDLSGIDVELLNNDTGEPFDPAITGVSDSDGYIAFNVPAGFAEVAVRTTSAGFMNTLHYSYARNATDEEFLIVSDQTISIVSNLLGVTLDDSLSHAAGAVYWGSESDENPIGCATVAFDPAATEIHYFGSDALPTHDRDTLGTNKDNGYFIGLNVDVVPTVMTAEANGHQSVVNVPKLYAKTVVIQNFYYSKADYSSLDQLQSGSCE